MSISVSKIWTLKEKIKDKGSFVILMELACGPGFNFSPVEKFLKAYKEQGDSYAAADFSFVGITVPQNPSGVPNFEPAEVLSKIREKELLCGLDFMPHVSCKDQNRGALVSSLRGFKEEGIESLLVLSGDKPIQSKGVFELGSIGLLDLVHEMNLESYLKTSPGKIDEVHQFYSGAAVSPFKYTEASQMQQYFKMEKKIAAGAEFLITQLGYDWRKSLELFQYLKERSLDIRVIGNVYFLSNMTAAPRLMNQGKLAGCYVSDELLAKIYSETVDAHIERAAQQTAMYKSIGAAGVDISGLSDFGIFAKIIKRADEIGDNWQQYKENLYWPRKDGFYLYEETGKRIALSKPHKKFKLRLFNFFHRAFLNPDYRGFRVFRSVMKGLGTEKGKGFFYKLFIACERTFKYLMFECNDCGDCYLPENFGHCSIGPCEKGLSNPPCGDATVEGYCGSDEEKICIGEKIYEAAASEKDGLERLKSTINMPRNPELKHTSSILNYLFARDHTMKKPVIMIGESVHASIPKTGKIMKQLAELGPDAYQKPSGPLNYIRALIESQAREGADYIEVNLDAFGEEDPQATIDIMVEYTRLVRQWGQGVPICIDSSDDNVLIAGLKEWYNSKETVKQPLINSVKVYTIDKMLPFKKDYDFAFIGLLVGETKPGGPGGSHSVDELFGFAMRLFESAVDKYRFKPEEIFFDSTVFPLAIDMPMEPNVPGYTYRAFETIKKIRKEPIMKGVHCSLGVSNAVRDLPGRRIGVCRAYLGKAIEYGLDAAIVNVAHRYGHVEPAPELLELIDVFAKMDGSSERLNEAMSLMGKFCQENRKPVK
ncbi:MAG: methylenetetrahydrofolate reductase C-terminal domain-containing protein [Planctomycetota bacterium]